MTSGPAPELACLKALQAKAGAAGTVVVDPPPAPMPPAPSADELMQYKQMMIDEREEQAQRLQKYAEARADFAAKVAFDTTLEAGGSETAAKQVTAHISNPWPRSLRRTPRGRHTVCTVPHRRPRRHGLTRWRRMLMNGVNILRHATLTDPHAGTGHTNQGACGGRSS